MIAKSWLGRCWQWQIGGCVAIFGALSGGVSDRVNAQIVPDNTLGAEGSVVTPNVFIRGIQGDRIDGGAPRGANLFHSFQEFNAGEGRGVYFANPTGIENILTRVTGSNPSNILGRLGVLGGANLFLLNPNGILFGPNASLDIQGSFVATTAERIQLGDSGYFSAAQPQTSSLLSVSPGALFFNEVANQPTAIINQGNLSTGKHLTLSAGNLDLQGQLLSGGDLTLQAQDTVKVRDSAAIPFIASAGGNLLVQGNHRVDIFALNHPESGLFSGGDMVLRSSNTVGGDAHYWSGGSFRIEQLDGSLGNLFSPHDPIMRVRGDVFIQTYQGASLHILAGGKVEIPGGVRIQGADPQNGLVETVNLADGTTVSINGKSKPTLDIRAGVNPDVIGGPFLTGTGTFSQPAYGTSIPSSADIRIGTILFADAASRPLAGRVLLTNQYQPNSSLSGDIQVTQTLQGGRGAIFMAGGAGNPSVAINSRGSITLKGTLNTSSSSGDGGAIALSAQNNITTGTLDSFTNGAGKGGNITLRSTGGSIDTSTGVLNSSSISGNGGAIALTAQNNITTGGLYSDSQSDLGDAGQGGAISLEASNGSISTGNVNSSSYSDNGIAGNGGTIRFFANNGNIQTGFLASNSRSNAAGSGGNGGDISLFATDNINVNSALYSYSSNRDTAGNGGAIGLTAANNIFITGNLESYSRSTRGNAGQGGAINLTAANNNITTGDLYSYSQSDLGDAGQGGAINLTAANNNITTGDLYSYSRSTRGDAGQGGAINLTAANDILIDSGLYSYSQSDLGDAGQGGAINLTAANDINITGYLFSASRSNLGGAGQGGAINLTAANNIFIDSDLASYSFAVRSRAASGGSAANGGAISLFAGNGINITGDSYAYSLSEDGTADGTARNGGTISLVAVNGNISTGNLNSDSRSDNSSAANGGAINISATNGSISTGFLLSSSNSDFGVGANGGAITLEAANDIKIEGDLNSFSYSRLGTAGRGGEISLRTTGGDISGIRNQSTVPTVLGSFSISEQGTAGNGGNVTLEAKNKVSNLEILTLSSDSQSGTVQVTGLGDLLLTDTKIQTSKQVTVPKPFDIDGFLTLDVGEESQSGDVTVTSSGNLTFNKSSIQSDTKGSDPAGDVTISSPGLVTFTDSQIISNTNSTGQAGNITIQAPEIQLDSISSLSAQTSSSGSAGNLTLQPYDGGQTLSVLFEDGAQISASTSNQGTGGNIEIKAPDSVTIQGQGTITTSTTGTGNAGNITLDTSTLTIARGAQLFAFTEGSGNSGTITVNASTAVNLGIGVDDFSPVLSVETSNAGKAGNITINTPSLTLSDTARITATATSTATNRQGGGSITLNASTMDLAGVVGVFAETQGQSPAGTLTLKPYQNQSTLNLTLAPQSLVSASTTGSGKGGNLIVQAPEAITIQGPGQLSVETTGDGAAGDLRIDTQRLTIADGATISASTSSKNPNGTGGSIIINATESFNLTNQASLRAQSTGAAQAGNVIIKTEQLTANNGSITTSASATSLGEGGSIEVNASQINLSGTEIGLLAETQGVAPAGSLTLQPFENGQNLSINLQDNAKISAATSGSGEGGSLSVKAPEAITIQGPGQLSVETIGDGAAGDLRIDTQRLTLADGATISASTSSKNPEGTGGSIIINATESFNLTNQASLLAQSTGAAQAGNVIIKTEQLTANNGSITTSASATSLGEGGSIEVNASQINLSGTEIGLLAETQGVAPAGSLTLQPFENGQNLNINLQDNAKISAATSGSGEGGSLSVKAPEAITIRGPGQLSVETIGDGAAGDLRIDTQRLTLADGATISASTSSKNPEGTGGSIIINATESFNLTNQASLLAQSTGAAQAGNVIIKTEQLTANNGSITTSASATSLGEGGSIEVNASQINLSGTEIGLLAETQGVAPAGSLTLQPFENGQNLNINLQDNAKISAATSGSGEGGSLSVKAPEAITIQGPGQLSVETTGDGAAGDLRIDTQRLTLADGATISASTSSKNPEGVGGNLTINATESFNLTNVARLLAQSTGAAPAGNITIHTGQLTANNGSIETSATQSAGGGITITASDIRLFGDSDIRTDVASGAGGGGNINLTANSIIAFGDSDILAYAADGKGGDITFKTPIFFGFAYSPAPKGTDPDTLDYNNQVDINATGAVEGVISLPNLSFIQNSLTELPSNQINTDSLLANSCIVRRNQPTRGSFTITGTGGLPQRPGDAQMSSFPTVNIETLPSDSTPTNTNPNRPWQKGDPIVEPQGVYRLPNGKLVMSRECSRIQ